MGKKKKSKKKKSKKHLKEIFNMDSNQLFDKAINKFNSKKFKEAIKFLRLALKNEKSTEQLKKIKSRLFDSYIEREKELRQKGLIAEADSIRNTVINNMPAFSDITESQMLLFLGYCDLAKVFEKYGKYLTYHKRSSDIEIIIADKLVIYDCWNLLKKLPDPSVFEKYSGVIKHAASLMNESEWEDAMIVLKAIPRTSPFAHLKMLCRAMLSFYAGNDMDMIKAGAMVPDISVFKPITNALKLNPNDKIKGKLSEEKQVENEIKIMKYLWNGDFEIWNKVEFIIDQVKKGKNSAKLRKTIAETAMTICPDSPDAAMIFMLEAFYMPGLQEIYDNNNIYSMAKKLVKSKADIIKAKADFVFSDTFLESAGKYLGFLKKEFPDSKECNIAESLVIQNVVETMNNNRNINLFNINRRTKNILGIKTDDYFMAMLEMVLHGVNADPKNKELFVFASKILAIDNKAVDLKIKLMLLMAESFPEDPFPYLELSMLYHRKNAFRKAETVLQKAITIAPNDHRVVDKQIITLLLAADRNAARSKFHLVWKDVEKAEQFNSGNNDLLVKAKKLFYQICENSNISLENLKNFLNRFSVFEKLKMLTIIFFSFRILPFNYQKKFEKKMLPVLKNEIACMKNLTTPEITELLLPFQEDWQLLFPIMYPALFFLKPSLNINGKSSGEFNPLNNVFDAFSDAEFLNVMERILHPDLFSYFIVELEKRSRKNDKDVFIKFYLLILKQLNLQGLSEDFDLLKKMIEKVDDNTKEELRVAARKLSKYAIGDLKTALEEFDFNMINPNAVDPFFNPFIDDDDYYYDDDDEFDDDEFDDDEFDDEFDLPADLPDIDNIPKELLNLLPKDIIIKSIEKSIDEAGLRDAPPFMLEQAKEEINAAQESKFMKSFIKKVLNKKDQQKLSKEAKFIYI